MKHSETWKSHSAAETIERARWFGKQLKAGTVIALVGDLGSGKTTFVKGLALGLGVRDAREVKSPTFVILHVYEGSCPLYHFDLYRLDSESDLETIGADEFLGDPQTVSVVEWADRIPQVLKQADFKIELKRSGETDRTIRMDFLEHSKSSGR